MSTESNQEANSVGHTPGPWFDDPRGHGVITDTNGLTVATVNRREDSPIVASCTDLLEALELMVDVGCEFYDMDMGENGGRAIEIAQSAIAKAKGVTR